MKFVVTDKGISIDESKNAWKNGLPINVMNFVQNFTFRMNNNSELVYDFLFERLENEKKYTQKSKIIIICPINHSYIPKEL